MKKAFLLIWFNNFKTEHQNYANTLHLISHSDFKEKEYRKKFNQIKILDYTQDELIHIEIRKSENGGTEIMMPPKNEWKSIKLCNLSLVLYYEKYLLPLKMSNIWALRSKLLKLCNKNFTKKKFPLLKINKIWFDNYKY